MSERETIVLDLAQSEAGILGSPDSFVQKKAQIRLHKLIEHQLAEILESEAAPRSKSQYLSSGGVELSYPRRHNAILVEGGRGSGKTTFLLNALGSIERKEGLFQDTGRKVRVLPVVDPTLIETKQHIIVVILSMIEAAVEDCVDEDGHLASARHELAEGLGLLDGIGNTAAYGAEWEDASWVMSRGLEKARRGHSFERKLNTYLDRALSLLRMQAFVLSFDDIDTNFAHGFTILETIRKYLTSPRLVIILSGDLDLYGRLLRQNIYKTFGQQVLDADVAIAGRSKSELSNSVLELEEQYLLKIVPPQKRISMLSLGGVMQWYDVRLGTRIFSSDSSSRSLVQDWASLRIRQQLHESAPSRAIHPFFAQVAKEHMRLVVGYLRALEETSELDSRKAVLTVFEARMRAQGVPADILEQASFDYALKTAFEWIARHEDAAELMLFGIPVDRNKAVALHCLALTLGHFLEEGAGPVLRTLLAFALPLAMMRRPGLSGPASREAMKNYLWIDSSPSTPDLVARIGAVDREGQEIGKGVASSFGSVAVVGRATREELAARLYGLGAPRTGAIQVQMLLKSSKDKWNRHWLNALVREGFQTEQFAHGLTWFTIDDLASEDRIGRFSRYLNLAVTRRFTARGEVNRSVSALSIFAAISEILVRPDDKEVVVDAATSIMPAFHRQEGTMVRIDAAVEDDDMSDTVDSDYEEPERQAADEQFESFEANMAEWTMFACSLKPSAALSPSLIGGIARRIHDDLQALDAKVTSAWKTGEILHRQITNILHCVLATTSDHVGRKESPKTSDRPLIELLSRGRSSIHPFAAVLLSCPLVWAFLQPVEQESGNTSHVARLRKAAVLALQQCYEVQKGAEGFAVSDGSNGEPRFEDWISAPEVSVLITAKAASATSNKNAEIRLKGFYELLNLVPRRV